MAEAAVAAVGDMDAVAVTAEAIARLAGRP